MPKSTNYSELRNLLIVVSFNQPTGEHGQKFQPVIIEGRCEAITEEGAVRNVRNELKIGQPVATKLTNEELYKTVFGISEVMAKSLEGVLLESVAEDMKTVDTSKVPSVGLSDIKSDVEE